MFDITKHNPKFVEAVHLSDDLVWIGNKSQAITIAKHFYEQLSILDQLKFITSITNIVDIKSFGAVPQSETTYKGKIGEIKNNELFNKEGDLHG